MKFKVNWLSSAVLSSYLLVNGIIYLTGFWSFFKVNVFQFIEFKDVVKSTVMPLIISIILFLFHAITNHYNTPDTEKREKYLKAGGIFKGYIYLSHTLVIISGLIYASQIVYDIFFETEEYRLPAYIMILSPAIFLTLIFKTNFLSELEKLRTLFLGIIVFFPLACINKGINDAEEILRGNNTFIVDVDDKCKTKEETNFRYISTLSDKVFAISLHDKSICIFKSDSLRLTKETAKVDLTKGT